MSLTGTRSFVNLVPKCLRLAAEATAGPAKFYGAAPRPSASRQLGSIKLKAASPLGLVSVRFCLILSLHASEGALVHFPSCFCAKRRLGDPKG